MRYCLLHQRLCIMAHPPRLSPPVVPRPSHRETPEPQPYLARAVRITH
jgi:hypothetical protein